MNTIDETERAKRAAAVRFARVSVALEGITLSPAIEAISRDYVDGKIDVSEHVAAIQAVVLGGHQ